MTTILSIFGIVIIVLLALPIGAGHYAFSITPKASDLNPSDLELDFEDIYFQNDNGEVLHAWWLRNLNNHQETLSPTLIMLHGWNRNCQRMLPYLEHLHELPMNILVIEGRGHGENSKNTFISQVGFGQDISAALNWLVLQPEVNVQRIGVLGHSIGAAATIYASYKDPRISAFIADSSYAHPKEIINRFLRHLHIPFFPIGWLMQQYIQIRLGTTFDKVAPENVITKMHKPGLLIHGDKDQVVPVDDAKRIQGKALGNVESWIAEGYHHSNTTEHPDFPEIVRNFIQRTLLNSSETQFDHVIQEEISAS
jgi:pimeloyl-ACP methyl ester carboxylesterase